MDTQNINAQKIELTISTHTLGVDNTAEDNQRYVDAVRSDVISEYPSADVSVELVKHIVPISCRVSDDPTGEIADNVNHIANQAWDNANY